MLNNCSFIGRVIADPRFNTVGDKSVLNFTLSVPTGEPKKEGDQYLPSFMLEVALWGKYADSMLNYITKGTKLAVSGNMRAPKGWTNSEGEVKCNAVLGGNVTIELLGSNENSSEGNSEVDNTKKTSSKQKDIAVDKKANTQDLFD